MTEKFMRSVVNRELSLITILEELGVVSKGALQLERTCYRPFHDNTESKAAKIYDDEAGVTLFCFAEQKSFRSSDAIAKFSDKSLQWYFDRIWQGLSPEDQMFYLDQFESSNDVLTADWQEVFTKLKGFRSGKLSYDDVCSIILENVRKTNGQN